MNNKFSQKSKHHGVICNTRILSSIHTGVQRYTNEILERLGRDVSTISPKFCAQGIFGHAWEQFILPSHLDGKTLWSPSNSGPLNVENQVVSIMDITPLDHPEWMGKKFASWYRFLTPRLVKKVRAIITISEFSRDRLIHYFPAIKEKIFVTPLASDERFKRACEKDILNIIHKYKIPTRRYILVLGSLEPRKNLTNILSAWKRVVGSTSSDIHLIIAGALGSTRVFGINSFEYANFKLPDRAHLIGYVDDNDLPALYSGATLLVYLSLYEGFGLPPLEAMSCATPVLTSNITSLPEVVGVGGLMANPYNVADIAHQMHKVINNATLLEELSEYGLLRSQRFSWEKTTKFTKEILDNAANR